jgi:anti-sigma factor RsiW
MLNEKGKLMDCTEFEDRMSDYLDRTLDALTRKAAAAHVLKCPICHSLVNDVKESLMVCRQMAEPKMQLTRLEAKILSSTIPDASLHCNEFEDHLTDYLDGFLPAQTFHRWERHAVLCEDCTDLPGAVVRSIAAIVAYKSEELPVPFGMNDRILELTLGTTAANEAKASWASQFGEWVRGIRIPISVPQLAPVAMMLMFAFLFVSQTVSADGSLSDVYSKSVHLAEQTYKQGAEAWQGRPTEQQQSQQPVANTTFVDSEGGN